jgi:hypothetical protein
VGAGLAARAAIVVAALVLACPAVALAAAPTVDPSSSVFNVFDTHADVQATINPNGEDTHWQISYATDAYYSQHGGTYDQQTASLDLGSGTSDQTPTQTITGLSPNTAYHFIVTASNASSTTPAQTLDNSFTTIQQLAGVEGSPETTTFSVSGSCPASKQVNWGDGSSSDVVPTSCDSGAGTYILAATHTYAEEGHYDISSGPADDSNPLAGAQITDAPLTASPVAASATAGTPFSGTVATFTDADPAGAAGDYTATIDWGDGTQSAGTITAAGGGFSVAGSHTYATGASEPVTVTITDAGGSSTVAHSTMGVAGKVPRLATLFGNAIFQESFLPGVGPLPGPDARAQVQVTLTTPNGTFQQSTTTDANGVYQFTNLPACSPAGGDKCVLTLLGNGGTISDQVGVTLPARISRTSSSLTAGRIPNRFYLGGGVLQPGQTEVVSQQGGTRPGPTSLATDITISIDHAGKLTPIYDALRACERARWGDRGPGSGASGSCVSSTGVFLLSGIPLAKPAGQGPAPRYVATLLEAARRGGRYVPVDSVRVKLPANTPANDADPPYVSAPALHAVSPVPNRPAGRSVAGQVTQLTPYLPGSQAGRPHVIAGVEVRLSMPHGKALTTRTTQTDSHGDYVFTDVPACSGAQCTVEILSGPSHTVEDLRRFHLSSLTPSVALVDLNTGRVSNRFFVNGFVVAPSGVTTQPSTDVTISFKGTGGKLTQVYDALATCRRGGWESASHGPACASGLGSFLLDRVPVTRPGVKAGTRPTHAVITLLERNPAGRFVAVDSATLKLPADTKHNNEDPQTVGAPLLNAIDPVPASPRGRTVSGVIGRFAPNLPGAPAPFNITAGATVKLLIQAGKTRIVRTVRSDRSGVFAFSDLPACNPAAGNTCLVTVVGPGEAVEDQHVFRLSNRSPSGVTVDLEYGLMPQEVVLQGQVNPPIAGAPVPATDLQISVGAGDQSQVVYDALTACQRGRWTSTGPCRAGAGFYDLASVPTAAEVDKTATGPMPATLTLLERNSAGQFVPVDSGQITLPARRTVNDSAALVIGAPTLQG